jgi:IclR family transcriptional regulator, pca regulon regulatory protein
VDTKNLPLRDFCSPCEHVWQAHQRVAIQPVPELQKPNDQFVQSFARGLSVIRAFGPDAREMTLSEVADRTSLTRAAARRILLTLQQLGYVAATGRKFFLTPRILDLGYSYLSTTPLWDLAEPYMEELVSRVHESSSASVLDGTDIVYILRVPTKKIMTISLSIGSRLPAYCTSMGRILLGGLSGEELDNVLRKSDLKAITPHTVIDPARLKQIIRDDCAKGWSLVNQELEEGLVSLSVPIQDRTGRIVAAMNVSGQATRTSADEMVRTILPQLQRAALQIGDALKMRAA